MQPAEGFQDRSGVDAVSANHQWLKFWPQDWQRDPALRSCGIAARGLWIDMLCIMHEGNPYGHLTIGGKPATVRQIGMVTGCGEKEAGKLIAELEDAGVFSRDDAGTIYSRRMVRDKVASDAGRKNGQSGGNPALKGEKAKKVNGGGNPGGLTPDLTGGPNTKKKEADTEAEAEKKEPPKPPANGGLACEAEFELFWQRYPRRDSKGHARKAWAAAVRKAGPDAIIAGLERYRFSETPRFVPLPATWLNGERWLSDDGDDGFDPVLRAVGLTPEDFDQPLFPHGWLLQ
jgi:hypothetical protein